MHMEELEFPPPLTSHAFLVAGLHHLLQSGRGVGGASEEEAAELKTACFMGLLSVIANKHEVLKVTTWNMKVCWETKRSKNTL